MDYARAIHETSEGGDQNGALLYTTEMEGGSSDESQYPHTREVSCAACSAPDGGYVYTRWGSTECANDAGTTVKLYDGFIAGSHYSHNGGGYNYVCMHPEPQFPEGFNDGDHNGNLLYGTEYENTGAIDANHDGDGACAHVYLMCLGSHTRIDQCFRPAHIHAVHACNDPSAPFPIHQCT